MKNRWLMVFLAIVFILCPLTYVRAQDDGSDPRDFPRYPVMKVDPSTYLQWAQEYASAPQAFINEELNALSALQGSRSLLGYLQYTPSERNQVNCGNCWVWGATGVMEIALNVSNGIRDRLSIQYLDSCKGGNCACCGGSVTDVANFYKGAGGYKAIPWSNTYGYFHDGSVSCSTGSCTPAVSCGSISTSPNYPMSSIQDVTIPTQSQGQATAIANIKNVLNQNKALTYRFCLANSTDWNAFFDFWDYQNENAVWYQDNYCGHAYDSQHANCHIVTLVGYDDSASPPYWLLVNSWGTTANRPNGLFRLAMNMNYDCYNDHLGEYLYFQTLNVTYNTPARHRAELIGLWPGAGIWYWNFATSSWTQIWNYALDADMAAGDFTADGRADVALVWPGSGLWVRNVAASSWTFIGPYLPSRLAAGDVTGDGRAELIGLWPGAGIWYWNFATSSWTQMWNYALDGDMAAGDFTGDGRADVATVWPGLGLYMQNGATLGWTFIGPYEPARIAAGDVTGS